MNKYLQLFRLQNCAIGIIGILASAFIAVEAEVSELTDSWFNVILACVIIITFMAGGNALNDYVDRDIDKIGHPERPIPSGRMQPKSALYAGCMMLGLAVALSLLFQDILSILIVIVACLLMLAYELGLKQRGFVGNVTIAVLTGGIFLLGGAIVDNIEGTYMLVGMAVLVNIGREITKDIEDMDGDKDRKTLPMSIGVKNAGVIAAIFFISGVALSIWPLYTGMFGTYYISILVPDAMFIYASYILFSDPRRSQKVAKIAMLVAFVAFIFGVI